MFLGGALLIGGGGYVTRHDGRRLGDAWLVGDAARASQAAAAEDIAVSAARAGADHGEGLSYHYGEGKLRILKLIPMPNQGL